MLLLTCTLSNSNNRDVLQHRSELSVASATSRNCDLVVRDMNM